MASKKIAITVQDDLLERMDAFAERNAMTRSGLIATSVAQYLNAVEAMPNMNKVLALMGSLAKRAATGGVDSKEYDAELAELEEMQSKLSGGPFRA